MTIKKEKKSDAEVIKALSVVKPKVLKKVVIIDPNTVHVDSGLKPIIKGMTLRKAKGNYRTNTFKRTFKSYRRKRYTRPFGGRRNFYSRRSKPTYRRSHYTRYRKRY